MKTKLTALFEVFVRENELDIALSFEMPQGYENAYGTYDPLLKTLFLNKEIAKTAPEYEVLFYLYHELRHAVQYACPDRFAEDIRQSLKYVVLYDGTCMKLEDGIWKECVLSGNESDFTRAYLNLPYEKDANRFAYQKTLSQLPECLNELNELWAFWTPQNDYTKEEYAQLFRRIDDATK